MAAQRPAGPAAGISFLSFGDSYAIREGVAAKARRPVQLAVLARAQGVSLQAPDLIARTGWTTAELQAAISAALNAPE